jgi:ubiquinone/menaquinone biosynthesis C-methylase UbiE
MGDETSATEVGGLDVENTAVAQSRYDRQARFYDLTEAIMERLLMRRWRRRQWSGATGPRVLEVGVGTGRNLPYHPADADVAAVDLSPRMLRRAAAKARKGNVPVSLGLMDAQALAAPDASFDNVIASFVFCSVPDPVLGLREVRRVLRPGGRAIFLEHVRSRNRVLGWLMDRLNGLSVRMTGANINRDTVANVESSGLRVVSVQHLLGDVVKLIEAEP